MIDAFIFYCLPFLMVLAVLLWLALSWLKSIGGNHVRPT